MVALGWLVWDGLGWDSSPLLHMISHPLADWPGLVYIAVAGYKKESGSTHLRLRLGAGTLLLLLHSNGQSKSKGQPRFGGLGGETDCNS